MVLFTRYPVQSQAVSPDDGSVYADVLNHCKRWQEYVFKGDKLTSAHECTHGINADLRNAAGGKVNAFYVRRGRSIVLAEPSCKKHDAADFVPDELRGSRYKVYVTEQEEWDNQPLYLYDEWVAYTNQAWCGIDCNRRGGQDGKGSDVVCGTLEFVAYAVALLLAVCKVQALPTDLLLFTRWHLRESFNAFFLGRALFPFQGQDELLGKYQTGSYWQAQRTFLMDVLSYAIPRDYEAA